MAAPQAQVEFRLAWWFDWYLKSLIFFCALFARRPDEARLERMVYRALRVRKAGD